MTRYTENGFVKLPSGLVERCSKFARMIVARYAAGGNEASRSVSYRDADKNIDLWTEAKMAECVFAIESDRNPNALNWTGEPDDFDFVYRSKQVDVKSTRPTGQFLLWSIRKNGLYDSKHFDCLVLTKVNPAGVGRSVGYVPKQEFFERKKVAGKGHQLDEGTWFMDELDLRPMSDFYRRYAWRGNVDGPPLEWFCETCGKPAPYGFDVSVRKGIGTWYCREHRPATSIRSPIVVAGETRSSIYPDLQKLVEVHGGYDKITPEAWAQFDGDAETYRINRSMK